MPVAYHRRPLLIALLLSILLHAAGLLSLSVPEGEAVALRDQRPIEVALIPPQPPAPAQPAVAPRQMVSPPDEINDRPPDRARFESDRDNTVLNETVHPGVPNPAVPAPPPKPAAARKQSPSHGAAEGEADDERAAKRAAVQGARAPALEDLFASTDELVHAQQAAHEREQAERDNERAGAAGQRLALSVAPVAPEWALSGDRGTLDHLPDIQRGDVTLLNTKANVFAPFVRRVGERVFQHLIIRQRRLQLEEILSAQSPVRMHVLLDPHGRLKSVRVDDQSGSATMDDTLSDAVHTAAFDNNPPAAAANANGEYEFVFQAQLRAFQPGAGTLPSRIESRLSVALM